MWLELASVLAAALAAPAALGVVTNRAFAGAAGFHVKRLNILGADYPYAVYIPRDDEPDRVWPVLVFLHGAGECGVDGRRQLDVGLAPAIKRNPERWPFVAVFPQKPTVRSSWIDHQEAVLEMIARAGRDVRLDESRAYITGISQGGNGAMALAAAHPRLFAAVAPVCGYGDPDVLADGLRGVPMWCFHGGRDRIVPADASAQIVEAVRTAGGRGVVEARLTVYPEVEHNSWDAAYDDPELPRWLLRHQRDTA